MSDNTRKPMGGNQQRPGQGQGFGQGKGASQNPSRGTQGGRDTRSTQGCHPGMPRNASSK